MSYFDDFNNDLLELIKKYEKKNFQLKIEHDPEFDIVKIFGENFNSLSRAKNGLNDVAELAYTTAEHHPYWNLLSSCVQILQTILEKWEDKLNKEDLDEIKWFIHELEQTCIKIQEKNENLRQR